MIWIFLLVVGSAVVMFKLGAYAAWIAVLKIALYVLVAVIGVTALISIWKRVFRR